MDKAFTLDTLVLTAVLKRQEMTGPCLEAVTDSQEGISHQMV